MAKKLNQKKLVQKLVKASNIIGKSGVTSKANWVVVNPLAHDEVKRFFDEQERKAKRSLRKKKLNKLWKKKD